MRLPSDLQNGLQAVIRALLLLGIMTVAPSCLANEKITGVRVWQAPDNTRIVFDLSGPIEHRLFTLQNPNRVVIDMDATDKSPSLDFLEIKNGGPVVNVRSAPQPNDVLRVVLDLNQKVQPKSFLLKPNEQYGTRLVIELDKLDTPTAPAASEQPTPPPAKGQPRDIVVAIDAGHGGEDPGAIGGAGTREKDVTLQIAQRLYAALSAQKGIKPMLVRKGDYYIPLATRREIARKKFHADLFVSVHADAFGVRSASGASVYALSRSGATSTLARVLAAKENESDVIGGVNLEDKDDTLASVLADLAMEGTMEHSIRVGRLVLSQVGKVSPLHTRRLEQAGFAVLKSPDIPSILVETGFISNPVEERKLRTSDYQTQMADAIGEGVLRYFDQQPPPGSWFAQRKQGENQATLDARHHRIRRGETLSTIAQQYQVSISDLLQYNSLSQDAVIHAGQVLRIPSS